jgi:hypothetical protein
MALDDAFEAWRRRASDTDILKVAQGNEIKAQLIKKSREWVGACPLCGGGSDTKGKKHKPDGFAVNPEKRVFNCRRGGAGGDVIAMVMHVREVPFLEACEIIIGEPPPARGSVITEGTRKKGEQLKEEAEKRQSKIDKDDNIYRAREIRALRDIRDRRKPVADSSAEGYAAIRGLVFPPAPEGRGAPLGCVEEMPYYLDKDTVVHRGPALAATIINGKRKFCGLHFTYIDLAQPKGKLQLDHDGELLDAKKSRGSKQGGFIPLCGPVDPQFLVMGEAIEKTVAVYMALESTGRDLSQAAFWSACDLGNLTGRAAASVKHPTLKTKTGRPVNVSGGVPDLTTPAIDIPDSVTDLVLLGDSTSDPFSTRLAMARASVRYARPGRTVRVAWAPDGVDFDDLLRETKGDQAATAEALKRIAAIVDGAEEFADTPAAIDPGIEAIDPAVLAQAIRKFGLEQLNAGLAQIKALTETDDRTGTLAAIAEQLGQLVGAEAIEEPFAKATLEDAALKCGLIGDIGIKAVKSAVTAALKLGKKQPRDLSHVRREATALSRPRPAAVLLSSPSDADEPAPGADPRDSTSLSSTFSVSSFSPRSPSPEEEGQPQTLEENADDGDIPPDDSISDETFRECAGLDQSDVDNGKRLIAYFGRDLMVRQEDDVPAGQMLAWTGTHWDLAGGEALAHLIGQRVGDLIKQEAAYIEFSDGEARTVNNAEAATKELKGLDPDSDNADERARVEQLAELVAAGKKARTALSTRRATRKKWGIATKNGGRISQMLKCAAPHLRRHPDAFNADPLKVATKTHTLTFVPIEDKENPDPDGKRSLVVDGRVQYRLVAKRGHDRDDLLTAVIPFAWDPKAGCRDFNIFLDLFQPEANEASYRAAIFRHEPDGTASAARDVPHRYRRQRQERVPRGARPRVRRWALGRPAGGIRLRPGAEQSERTHTRYRALLRQAIFARRRAAQGCAAEGRDHQEAHRRRTLAGAHDVQGLFRIQADGEASHERQRRT